MFKVESAGEDRASEIRSIIEQREQAAAWTEEQIKAEILNDFSIMLIAEDGGKAAAFVTARHSHESAEIENFATRPQHSRRGIGGALIKELFKILKEKSVQNVTLEVNENNITAINFYKKHGFKTIGKRKKFYNGQDALLMQINI